MLLRLLILAVLLSPLARGAETLRALLEKNRLATDVFDSRALALRVQGETALDAGQTVVAYREIKGDLLAGPLHLVRFGHDGRLVLRRDAGFKPEDNCGGSVLGISFLHGLTAVATHVNPSASCLLFFDRGFRMVRRIYGIDWKEVAPDELVIVENMIHFAPVHPERMQIANLLHSGAAEVYPLKDDPERMEFVAGHAKHMPSESVCAANNDPCQPDVFDEEITSLTTDGEGRFGFVAILDALHSRVANEPPDPVLLKMILYLYQRDGSGWLYCEKAIPDGEINKVRAQTSVDLNAAACKPNARVVADGSTAGFNPFPAN